jgi:hypothetical protein
VTCDDIKTTYSTVQHVEASASVASEARHQAPAVPAPQGVSNHQICPGTTCKLGPRRGS